MTKKNLRKAYRTVMDDHFASRMTITFDGELWKDGEDGKPGRIVQATPRTLVYEKVKWGVEDPKTGEIIEKGLRYGENPGQEAALYRLIEGSLSIGKIERVKAVPRGVIGRDVERLAVIVFAFHLGPGLYREPEPLKRPLDTLQRRRVTEPQRVAATVAERLTRNGTNARFLQ